MPNTKAVRSYKISGVRKIGEAGGVPSQGVPADVNSTYPVFTLETDPAKMNNNMPASSPENNEYKERMPSTIEPLGTVDLGPVNGKAK